MDFSNVDLKIFKSIIRDIVREEFSQQNISNNFFGTLTDVAADNKSATVKFATETGTVTLINKTNEILNIGDSVVVEAINGKLSNGVISRRLGKNALWTGTFKSSDTTPKTITVVNGVITTSI